MTGGGKMEPEVANQIAQEKFGKPFEELDSRERQSVGGTYGGNKRKDDMSAATGGDVHGAYSEMSRQQGGASREEGSSMNQSHGKMTQEEKESIAQERFGKSFDELETDEKRAVGGAYGGHTRKE